MVREIFEKVSGLNIFEKRRVEDDYCEVVFYSKDIVRWEEIITGFLGSAVKPSAVKPSRNDTELTEKFGGIQEGQTLFKKMLEGGVVIAMFWPWQDREHTTLKLALVRR